MDNILDQFDNNDEVIEEWRLYIGPNAQYYIRQFLQMEQGQLLSFNPYAFCFGFFWLLYRQMYKPAVIFLSVYFAEGYLESVIGINIPFPVNSWELIRVVAFFLVLGFTGNWIYYQHTQQEIEKIKSSSPSDQFKKKLEKRGGITLYPILILIFCVILLWLIQYQWRPLN